MNARRFGVSTIWAMFSRVTSKIVDVVVVVEERLDLLLEGELLGGELEVHATLLLDLTGRQKSSGQVTSRPPDEVPPIEDGGRRASAPPQGLEGGEVVGEARGDLDAELGVAEVGVGPGLRQALPVVGAAEEAAGGGVACRGPCATPSGLASSGAMAASLSSGLGCSAWKPISRASTEASGTCLAPITWAS